MTEEETGGGGAAPPPVTYAAHPRQNLGNQWQINSDPNSHTASGPNVLVQYIYENIGGSLNQLAVTSSTNVHYYVQQNSNGLWVITGIA